MIGLLIVAHGRLGESLIECAAYVLGAPPSHLQAIDLMQFPAGEAMQSAANALIDRLDQGEGVLVLTDLYGATPSNTVCKLVQPGRVEVVSGINLPMLLKALTYRSEPMERLIDHATRGGQSGILHIDACYCDA